MHFGYDPQYHPKQALSRTIRRKSNLLPEPRRIHRLLLVLDLSIDLTQSLVHSAAARLLENCKQDRYGIRSVWVVRGGCHGRLTCNQAHPLAIRLKPPMDYLVNTLPCDATDHKLLTRPVPKSLFRR